MTNPVKQNAADLPNANTAFFQTDGRTLSPQWRAFFRTLAVITGSAGGGQNLSALFAQVQQIASELGLLEIETGELQKLGETDPSAALIGALIGRIAALETEAMAAVMPIPARHADSLPDPVSVAMHAPVALPEPVFPARRDSDDLRKLLENV
ncbi:hypothetical protein PQQ63_15360 [Paraburkholderia metrosideri]|uniref:Uncharacterized protein n=1 Tax=Paraburkholderia metrosideri TaxID=580937 RepID=A0ABW9DTY1_9BURK